MFTLVVRRLFRKSDLDHLPSDHQDAAARAPAQSPLDLPENSTPATVNLRDERTTELATQQDAARSLEEPALYRIGDRILDGMRVESILSGGMGIVYICRAFPQENAQSTHRLVAQPDDLRLSESQPFIHQAPERLAAKVELSAIGVHALVDPMRAVSEWVSPEVGPSLAGRVLTRACLPACGYVAYDVLELKAWKLAHSFCSFGYVSDEARQEFLAQGLFFGTTCSTQGARRIFLTSTPSKRRQDTGGAAPTHEACLAHIKEVRQRSWRRRLHREWCRQQLEAAGSDDSVRRRFRTLHRFLGMAKDYDEEKRR